MNHKVVSVSDEEHKVKCQQNSNEIEDNQNEDNITDIPEIKDNQDDDNTTNGDRKELDLVSKLPITFGHLCSCISASDSR